MRIKEKILNECRENRKFLDISCDEMASYLVDVTKEDYCSFEDGKYEMSLDNLERIARLLCINKNEKKQINDYVDLTSLSEDEARDIANIVCYIVGEEDA